jgi:hypothetical protein
MINILNNFFSAGCSIFVLQILVNPFYQMVLKNPFNNLVENIWSKEYVDIGARKRVGEGLNTEYQTGIEGDNKVTHHNIGSNAILIPQYSRIKIVKKKVSFFV